MSKVFYEDLVFRVPDGVYEPREDSRLAADVLEQEDLDGKTLLDLGTGCGFLGIIAAANGAEVTAADINGKALQAARKNAEENSVDIDCVESDLFGGIDRRFDIIVFNAPYLPGSRDDATPEEKALSGGETGREIIDEFLQQAADYLQNDGFLLLVQSSLTGLDETLEMAEQQGLNAEVVATEKVPWEELYVINAKI